MGNFCEASLLYSTIFWLAAHSFGNQLIAKNRSLSRVQKHLAFLSLAFLCICSLVSIFIVSKIGNRTHNITSSRHPLNWIVLFDERLCFRWTRRRGYLPAAATSRRRWAIPQSEQTPLPATPSPRPAEDHAFQCYHHRRLMQIYRASLLFK